MLAFISVFLIFSIYHLILAPSALAFCPVCTIAIGTGFELSHWLGIDDIISGIWLGALTLYLGFWAVGFITKKFHFKNGFLSLLLIILSYLLTWASLQLLGAYTGQNLIFGLERVGFGIIIGSLVLPPALSFEKYLRRKNRGQAYFYFQKALIPVSFLLAASLLVNLLI